LNRFGVDRVDCCDTEHCRTMHDLFANAKGMLDALMSDDVA